MRGEAACWELEQAFEVLFRQYLSQAGWQKVTETVHIAGVGLACSDHGNYKSRRHVFTIVEVGSVHLIELSTVSSNTKSHRTIRTEQVLCLRPFAHIASTLLLWKHQWRNCVRVASLNWHLTRLESVALLCIQFVSAVLAASLTGNVVESLVNF